MLCLYFTSDLFFSSRVKPVAADAGYEIRFPGFEQLDFSERPEVIIFDLEFVSQQDLSDLLSQMKQAWPALPKTVAYAPHVKEKLLQSARDCGVEEVWARGQFNKNFASLFATN